MLELDVRGDMRPILEDLDKVQLQVVPAATVTALNNTAKHLLSVARKEIAAAAGVPQRVIYSNGKDPRRRLARGQATRRQMSVPIYLKSGPLNPWSVSPARARKEAKANKGWAFQPGWKTFPRRYKGEVHGSTIFPKGIVLRRKGKPRWPLEAIKIPLPGAISTMIRLTNSSGPYFQREFQRQLDRRLGKRSVSSAVDDELPVWEAT